MASNVTQNKHVITQELFDLPQPCVIKALKLFNAVDWRVK